ncbi:DUF1566 domain-containing protein [Aquella oligotrophica]|nr:DUF1566 domain-containing protein [Aquella oligotrophica]
MNLQQLDKKLSLKQIVSLLLTSALATACSNSGGGSNGNNNGGNGDVSSLQLVAPKTIYSLPSESGAGYIVINNPTGSAVKNLSYRLNYQTGSGTSAEIDPASAAECAVVAAYSQCNIKVTIPAGTVAGSIGVSADNSGTSLLSKLGRSLKADTVKNVAYSGIEQAAYNSLSGADGVTLSYYHTVINGTPYILVSGLVASANAGSFNNVVLVDSNNNPIPNQQLIAGSGSYTQGKTFSVLLPAPSGNNLSQTIKVQTQQVNNGQTTVVSTATTSSTLTTKENIGIAEMLPSAVYLTSSSPEQTISFVNTGDAMAQLQELTANNPNIEIVFNPTSLASGGITSAVLRLKNPEIAGTSGNISLSYNNGQEQTVTSGIVDQNVNPAPSPSPTPPPTPPTPPPPPPAPRAGLTAAINPDSQFYVTTASPSTTRQLTLTNTGDTDETAIIFTLPANFTISNGADPATACAVTNPTSPATISNTLQPGSSCTVTVTYNNSTATSQGTDNISIAYNYNGATPAPSPTTAAVSYQVTQSTASLSVSPSSHNFGSIVNNNTDASADVEFTITNSGDIATDGTSFTRTITGTNNTMFTLNNTGIAEQDQCSTSLAAGASCKVNVKFGPTATAVNPASATLNANYIPYSGQGSTAATSSLSGVSVSAASINITGPVASGFSGTGVSGDPYVVITNNSGTLTYTFTNTGTQDATDFYVTNSTLPTGYTRSGGTCASSSTGTNLPNTGGSNTCTVIYTINSGTAGTNNFNQNVMTEHWTDGANPSGTSQAVGSNLTYVTVQAPPALSIAISSIAGTSSSVMGTTPITFTATISGSGSSTLSATLANSVTGTIVSNPSPCALDTSGTTSCTFSIIPWNTAGFANSIVGTPGYDPFTPIGTDITLSATNGASITGVTANTINYIITTPYVYLAADVPGNATTAGTGITWGTGGAVATRFTVGSGLEANCITDNLTGLMWPKNGIIGFKATSTGGPITQPDYANTDPTLNYLSWANAATAISNMNAATINLCGHNDWYLPTVNDLASLINDAYVGDQGAWLSLQGFQNVRADNYWSSSFYAPFTDFAWFVYFTDGVVAARDITRDNFVWPVRLVQ